MSEVIIFVFGCFISLVVAGAVGLLLWTAAKEPQGELLSPNPSPAAAPPGEAVPATPRN